MTSPFLIALLALATAPQSPEQASDVGQGGISTYSLNELVMHQFEPVHSDPYELVELAKNMVGRQYFVRERGTRVGAVPNMSVLGRKVILYDTKDYVTGVMVPLLTQLDRASKAEPVARPMEVLARLEYTPRYVSLRALSTASESYRRTVVDENQGINNFSWSEESNTVIVRDEDLRLKEIQELFTQLDVPEPQVMLTCYLVQGTMSHEERQGLPPELGEHMGKLVPGMGFELAGFAMLRTSVGRGQGITMQLRAEGANISGYQLDLRPMAYAAATGTLSVSECSLGKSADGKRRLLFSADTLMRADEYTVLGASGEEPVFAVVRLAALPN